MGVFLVVLGGIFWAVSGVLAEYLFENHYSVEWVSFYRLFCTGILLIIVSLKRFEVQILTQKSTLFSLFIYAFFGLLLTQYGYFKAIFYTDAGTATMIQYSAPLMIMLFLCFKNKILPKTLEIFALILILSALFLIATGGNLSEFKTSFWGLFWALGAALGITFYSLCARNIIEKYGIFLLMGWASLMASGILLILLLGKIPSYDFDLKGYLALAGIIFIGTIGAFCLYLKGVEYIGALRASMIACIEPVAAAFMSHFFLKTQYSFLELFAFSLIIVSVFLNAMKVKPKID
ncbi:DMT family transporter [Campylobacter felis]|uniref:DMT family transporter n=1 Tax=Campylobacter felis TaxID=2974565 RepID=A0ABT7I2Y5_9BACT|nr:DMT family transporter [Campylobacter upsaliensis]MDL0103423.1 DMT family transporter [Campylobacter felis]MDL0108122.1 DMT family transporter [Campylobacter felis]MDL0146662.1 DMT family transporter [Campylobacter felis]